MYFMAAMKMASTYRMTEPRAIMALLFFTFNYALVTLDSLPTSYPNLNLTMYTYNI